MQKDLISRQEAIDKINERQRKLIYCFGFENDMVKIMNIAKSIITAIPPVQSEVIRCRDCKFAHITNDRRYCKLCDMFTDDYGRLIELYFDSNFYCGYAERGTDE